ncbi:MAG: hypothetical protein KDE48_10550 [Anaerolineales bacterium]|nr:hypothetical protein [Anaerolineales bacterium]
MQPETNPDPPINHTFRQANAADYEFLYNLNVISLREYIEATWGWEETWQPSVLKLSPTKKSATK